MIIITSGKNFVNLNLEKKMNKTNWASALVDVCIILLAVGVSVWQDNPMYLLLLLIMFFSGGYGNE